MSDHNSEANTFNNMPAPSALNIPTRMASRMHRAVPVIGWGAFKIGRNEGAKYPNAFDIPAPTVLGINEKCFYYVFEAMFLNLR